MIEGLGPLTATFSIFGPVQVPIEDDVRAILAARCLEPTRVRSRRFAGTAFIVVEQPGMSEADAQAVLGEVRALGTVRSAELECRVERRQPRPRLGLSFGPERIEVV